jgi:hypothetical protein
MVLGLNQDCTSTRSGESASTSSAEKAASTGRVFHSSLAAGEDDHPCRARQKRRALGRDQVDEEVDRAGERGRGSSRVRDRE